MAAALGCLSVIGLALSHVANGRGLASPPFPGSATRARLVRVLGQLPLSFEPNRGQAPRDVQFLARANGYTLFLTSRGSVLALSRGDVRSGGATQEAAPSSMSSAAVSMELAGGRAAPRIFGVDRQPSQSNYFFGNDPATWRTHIPNYRKVEYRQVYPGVDLVYYGRRGQLECDFVVAPGADPTAINWKISGARLIAIGKRGELRLRLDGGDLRFLSPRVYQRDGRTLQQVKGKYVLRNRTDVGFELAAYDTSRPLIIDPVLVYSTFLGGASNNNLAEGVAVDASGNAYLAGQTQAIDFPTVNAIQGSLSGFSGSSASDAFVAKLNPQGTALVYSTYLGGTNTDNAVGIATDAMGDALVTGTTLSVDFPLANPLQKQCSCATAGQTDSFVTKISPDGSMLVYSTYLGGLLGDSTAAAIASDSSGDAFVTGTTTSTDFPVASPISPALKGSSDAFVTEINPSGSQLAYSTYLGGTRTDGGSAIAVDASGSAYVTGTTTSTDFPTVSPFQAMCLACATGSSPFVTKINAAGSALVYSTYLGGSSGQDLSKGIAVDTSGNAYVTGHVQSTDFPLMSPLEGVRRGNSDAFVTKVDSSGSNLIYSTYLGGTADEDLVMGSIAVDQFGNAYVTGDTTSRDFPQASGLGLSQEGPDDAFVAVLNAPGSALFFSTYLGGSNSDAGRSIAVDALGNAYVAGSTNSPDFPTVAPLQSCVSCPTFTQAFLSKLSVPEFSIGPAAGSSSAATVTAGQSATYDLDVVSSGGFSGTVSLACSSTVPAGNCSLSTSSVTMNGSGSTSFTVTVATAAESAAAALPPPRTWLPAGTNRVLLFMGWLILALAAWHLVAPLRTWTPPARVPLALMVLLAALFASCGSGSTTSQPPSTPGTPAGSYTLAVTATSGSLSNSVDLSLTVQ